jgi:hypothetical protein
LIFGQRFRSSGIPVNFNGIPEHENLKEEVCEAAKGVILPRNRRFSAGDAFFKSNHVAESPALFIARAF